MLIITQANAAHRAMTNFAFPGILLRARPRDRAAAKMAISGGYSGLLVHVQFLLNTDR
jgi:hypothetical protein